MYLDSPYGSTERTTTITGHSLAPDVPWPIRDVEKM